jgi:hypothetical protein
MAWQSCVFFTHKQDEPPEDYKDAFSPPARRALRFALADGASNFSWSGEWAQVLTTAWVQCPPDDLSPSGLAAWLEPLQQTWHDKLEERLLGKPFYVVEKARRGQRSSLLGLKFEEANSRRWHADAVGDTCLFLRRDGRLETCFPLTDPKQFNDYPYLISSLPDDNQWPEDQLLQASGYAEPEDVFLLATDALAKWILDPPDDTVEQRLDLLLSLSDQEAFERFVEEERAKKRMGDDDTTLMVVSWDSAPPEDVEQSAEREGVVAFAVEPEECETPCLGKGESDSPAPSVQGQGCGGVTAGNEGAFQVSW